MPNYSSYPDHRMAYHLDGTQVYKIDNANNITQLNSTQIGYLNDESGSTTYPVPEDGSIAFIFPELRDLTNYFIGRQGDTYNGNPREIKVSTNTTNGVDGTWTNVVAPYFTVSDPIVPNYRTTNASSASGIKAVRIYNGPYLGNFNFGAIHLFGSLSSGEVPNRLELWHPTLNQRVSGAHFDFGDTTRGQTTDISFRVKNVSSTQTASSILVQRATLTDSSPTSIGNYTLSLNGGSFASTQTISSLSPGSISSTLTLRQTNPSNAAVGVWAGYVSAVASSWA